LQQDLQKEAIMVQNMTDYFHVETINSYIRSSHLQLPWVHSSYFTLKISLNTNKGISVFSGLLVGVLIKHVKSQVPGMEDDPTFVDEVYWLIPTDYTTNTIVMEMTQDIDMDELSRAFGKKALEDRNEDESAAEESSDRR
jgi:hypothetical protein